MNCESDIVSARDETESKLLRPLRFFGMGIFIAWLCCTHIPDIYCGESSVLRRAMDVGMRYGDVGTLVLLALFARSIGPIGLRVKASSALVLLSCAGTAFVGLLLVPMDASYQAVLLASFVTAIGGAVLFCLWAEIYVQMGMTRMVVYGAGSCIVAFLLYALVCTMKQPYAVIATSLFPAASFTCAIASMPLVSQEGRRNRAMRYPVPWKVVAIMAIAGFASGFAGALLMSPEGQGAIHRIWATGVAGGVILFLALVRPDEFDIRVLAHVSVPLAVLAFVLVPVAWSNAGLLVSFSIKLAYVWFTIFALMLLASISFRFELPTLRIFAIARACSEAAMFVGITLRRFLRDAGLVQDASVLVICSCVGIVGVCVCVLLWKSERAVTADWGAAGIEIETGKRIVSPRERLIMRCEQLAQEHGLTARETEVLTLIAQHKTRAEIEQELFLSQNTVKTHVRHVYAKLGVHSKSDVHELVGE